MILDFAQLTVQEKQHYLAHLVAPRPICFASTIDKEGNVNLSPFSFFNMFSYEPSILVFSTVRRMRNNTTKHTLDNVLEVPEVAINIVTFDIVQQMSLSSCDFPKGVNEFAKSGFTEEQATFITPPLVKESKAKFECKVIEVKPLGDNGGSGSLIICEVLAVHIDDKLLDADKKLDQRKLDLVARLGGDWYSSIGEQNLFRVPKPNTQIGIGIDQLPESIRNSHILTGNDLGLLANISIVPEKDNTHNYTFVNETEQHQAIKKQLRENDIATAWQMILWNS